MLETGNTHRKLHLEKHVSSDVRVLKTRKLLIYAVYQLLPKTSWQDMTVSVICKQAGLSRSTFYVHFKSKGKLLEAFMEEMLSQITDKQALGRGLDHNGTFGFIPHMLDNIQILQRVTKRQHSDIYSFYLVQEFLRLLKNAMELEIERSSKREILKSKDLTMLSAALGAQINKWLDRGCRSNKRSVLADFDQFAKSVLFENPDMHNPETDRRAD